MDPNELVTVYTVSNPIEAEIIKNALVDEGIACVLDNELQAAEAGLMDSRSSFRSRSARRAAPAISSPPTNASRSSAPRSRTRSDATTMAAFSPSEQAVCRILID